MRGRVPQSSPSTWSGEGRGAAFGFHSCSAETRGGSPVPKGQEGMAEGELHQPGLCGPVHGYSSSPDKSSLSRAEPRLLYPQGSIPPLRVSSYSVLRAGGSLFDGRNGIKCEQNTQLCQNSAGLTSAPDFSILINTLWGAFFVFCFYFCFVAKR